MDELRKEAIYLIADLWRGDWSGYTFDGRDGKRWLLEAVDGSENDVRVLIDELRELQMENY